MLFRDLKITFPATQKTKMRSLALRGMFSLQKFNSRAKGGTIEMHYFFNSA